MGKTDRTGGAPPRHKNAVPATWAAALFAGLAILFFVPACDGRPPDGESGHLLIYHLKNDATGITAVDYLPDGLTAAAITDELIRELATPSPRMEYLCPLSSDYRLLSYRMDGGQIILDVSEQYHDLPLITEILTRAALVRTLTQVDGVNTVTMTVGTEPLYDSTGSVIGAMAADMFIDNVGSILNAFDKADLRLYFAKDGRLTAVSRPDVVYATNVAIERLVVESLIGGPLPGEDGAATLNPAAKLLSVTNNDGTCYLNLDGEFLNLLPGITAEMAIYSLTNSLAELPTVSRVRISVSGAAAVIGESWGLATDFERNLDLVW